MYTQLGKSDGVLPDKNSTNSFISDQRCICIIFRLKIMQFQVKIDKISHKMCDTSTKDGRQAC